MPDDKKDMELLKNLINFGFAVRECHCRECVEKVVGEIQDKFEQFSDIELVGFHQGLEHAGTIH